jgi:hypothetical protein
MSNKKNKISKKPKNFVPKTKFKSNLPKTQEREIRSIKGNIKESIKSFPFLQSSRIQNKKAIIELNRKIYGNREVNYQVDLSFNELIKVPPKLESKNIFDIYDDIFYDIPKKGTNSHEYIVEQSKAYLNNYVDADEAIIDEKLEEIEKLEDDLFKKEIPEIKENSFYPNGSFLIAPVISEIEEYIEDVGQGLPIWVMQEGVKREIKNYRTFLTLKRAFGISLDRPNPEIADKLSFQELSEIPSGNDIGDDVDLLLSVGETQTLSIDLGDFVDYFNIRVTCLETLEEEPPLKGTTIVPTGTHITGKEHRFVEGIRYTQRSYTDSSTSPTCRVGYWRATDNKKTSFGIEPGETKGPVKARKQKPDSDPNTNYNYGAGTPGDPVTAQGEYENVTELGTINDWRETGYIRLEYMDEEGVVDKVRYVDTPWGAEIKPSHAFPIYSDFGTRMPFKKGWGDDSSLNEWWRDKLFNTIFKDPSNPYFDRNRRVHYGSGDTYETMKDVYGHTIYYLKSSVPKNRNGSNWASGHFFVKGPYEEVDGPLNDRRYVMILDGSARGKMAYFWEGDWNNTTFSFNSPTNAAKAYRGFNEIENMGATGY